MKTKLAETEAAVVLGKVSFLDQQPITGEFDFRHFRSIHHFLFMISTIGRGRYAQSTFLRKNGICLCRRDLSLRGCVFYLIGCLHRRGDAPIRKLLGKLRIFTAPSICFIRSERGNGRTQRLFFTQWIRHLGYEFDLSNADLDEFMIATICAAQGVMDPLIKFFDETIQEPIVGADIAL